MGVQTTRPAGAGRYRASAPAGMTSRHCGPLSKAHRCTSMSVRVSSAQATEGPQARHVPGRLKQEPSGHELTPSPVPIARLANSGVGFSHLVIQQRHPARLQGGPARRLGTSAAAAAAAAGSGAAGRHRYKKWSAPSARPALNLGWRLAAARRPGVPRGARPAGHGAPADRRLVTCCRPDRSPQHGTALARSLHCVIVARRYKLYVSVSVMILLIPFGTYDSDQDTVLSIVFVNTAYSDLLWSFNMHSVNLFTFGEPIQKLQRISKIWFNQNDSQYPLPSHDSIGAIQYTTTVHGMRSF